MELFNNFKSLFLSVWDRGILGVDIFQILIGIGIFLIFLIFRGIISKVIIKRLENIAKRSTNKTVQAVRSTVISGKIGVKSVKLMNSILLIQELSSSVVESKKL